MSDASDNFDSSISVSYSVRWIGKSAVVTGAPEDDLCLGLVRLIIRVDKPTHHP